MKQKQIQFLSELHKKIYALRAADRATFIFAESMDDYCLSIGYASAAAAYDDLPGEVKYHVYMTRNKANPIFYMDVSLVCTPHEVLFTDVSDPESNTTTLTLNLSINDSNLLRLRDKYA